MTNQERITAALAAIGFEPTTGFKYFHDASGVLLYVWPDGSVDLECTDPNWPAIPAVMTQVAEIVTPTLAINTVKEAASE
jgi:hypothetical protein